MKNVATSASLILVAGSALTGCRAIGGIFRAGIWSGVIIVVILFALIGGLLSFFRGR